MARQARYAHLSDFNVVADCFARKTILAILGVEERTIKRWRAGLSRIPWAAYQLLYEHSPYGLAERDTAERFQRCMILGQLDCLKQRVLDLECELIHQACMVNWGCANDPFIHPNDPRSKIITRSVDSLIT